MNEPFYKLSHEKCPKCHKPYFYVGDPIDGPIKPYCTCREEKQETGSWLSGWVCPKCGSVYSPFVSRCFVCGPKSITTGYTFTSSGE